MAIGKNIIVGVIYRPPNSKIDLFEDKMHEILGKIDRENKKCYLMGDFNIDLLKSESCDYTKWFLEQLFTSSYIPLVLRPTRITEHTATLIDNIFTNDMETIESSLNGIIFSDISDHLPIIHIRSPRTSHKTLHHTDFVCKRIINDANINSFSNTIKNMSWENVLSNNNLTESYNNFFDMVSSAYDNFFPFMKKVTKRNIDKDKSPWMTKCIAKSVQQKNKLYKNTYVVLQQIMKINTNNIKIN